MRIIVVVILGFILPFLSMGQVSVAVTSPVDTIQGGDIFEVQYTFNIPTGVKVTSMDFSSIRTTDNLAYLNDTVNLDKVMDIDIIDGGVLGLTNDALNADMSNRELPLQLNLKLLVSSAGIFRLPVPIVKVNPSQQTLPLERKYIYVRPNALEDLNEMKPIILEEVSFWDIIRIPLILLLAAIAIGLLIIWMIKVLLKKPPEVNYTPPPVVLPPHEIAIGELKKLKDKNLWQSGQEKEYHSELTRIVRQYLEDRYSIQALEMTTSQMKRSLPSFDLDKSVIDKIIDILQISDKVKFAKGKTGPEINATFMDEAFNIVEKTKEIKTPDTAS